MDRGSLLKIALVAVIASVVAWVYASGTYQEFDPATLRVWFREAGAWGGVIFIVAYSFLQPFGARSGGRYVSSGIRHEGVRQAGALAPESPASVCPERHRLLR